MHVGNYLGMLHENEKRLAEAFDTVAKHHQTEPDIVAACHLLSSWSHLQVQDVKPLIERYGEQKSKEPDKLISTLFHGPRSGGLGLMRDLHDIWLLAQEARFILTSLIQAALALRDKKMEEICTRLSQQTNRQLSWLQTRVKQAAPQALVAS